MDATTYQSKKEAYRKQLIEMAKNKVNIRFKTFEEISKYVEVYIKDLKTHDISNPQLLFILNSFIIGLEGILQRATLKQDIVSLNESLDMLEDIAAEDIAAFKKKFNITGF